MTDLVEIAGVVALRVDDTFAYLSAVGPHIG